jgi:hypothetical protein
VDVGQRVVEEYQKLRRELPGTDPADSRAGKRWSAWAWPGVRTEKPNHPEFYWGVRYAKDVAEEKDRLKLNGKLKFRPRTHYIRLDSVPQDVDPTRLFDRRRYTRAHFDPFELNPLEKKTATRMEAEIFWHLRRGFFAAAGLARLQSSLVIPGNVGQVLAGVLTEVLVSHGGLSLQAASDVATRHPWPVPSSAAPPVPPPLGGLADQLPTVLQLALWADVAPHLAQLSETANGIATEYLELYSAFTQHATTPAADGPRVVPVCVPDTGRHPVIEWIPSAQPIRAHNLVVLSKSRARVDLGRVSRVPDRKGSPVPLTAKTAWFERRDPSARAFGRHCVAHEAALAVAFCRHRIAPLRGALLAAEEMRQRIAAMCDPAALPSPAKCIERVLAEEEARSSTP